MPATRLLAAALLSASLAAQAQGLTFNFHGVATGSNQHSAQSRFFVRAVSSEGNRAATVPLSAGMEEAQLAAPLVAEAAANQLGIVPIVAAGTVLGFRLATVDGAAPARGCLFGTDDTGITGFVAEIAGGPVARFHGCAFAKAGTNATAAGLFGIEVVGKSTTDGHVFGVFEQVAIAAGDSAAVVNDHIRAALVAGGCQVFDIAMPSSGSVLVLTQPGFGIDRFDGLIGSQVGHQFRVFKIVVTYSGAALQMPRVVGLGWFPTGGFAEYGRGHSHLAPEPWVNGQGGFAPGESYDVGVHFARPTAGLLAIARERAGIALPGGASLLVDPATIVGLVPFLTGPSGNTVHHVDTPLDPMLVGQTLHYQGLGVGVGGLATTSGLYCRTWQ
ncbi:MAG TPA: hypothetical protein VFZ65_12140 [Planctomycetota bacterium]|nr:hypothetical protein [Planctomycetota bacterium]